MFTMRLHACWLLGVLLACGGTPVISPAGRCDEVRCTGHDLCNPATGLCETPDAGVADAGLPDAGVDAGAPDAAVDAGNDSGIPDGGSDAGFDAGLDAGFDAGTGCQSDNDCGVWASEMPTGDRKCVECLTDINCFSGAPVCNRVRNVCVGCVSNANCSNPSPVCNAGFFQCEACDPANDTCSAGQSCALDFTCQALPESCGTAKTLAIPGTGGSTSFSVELSRALDDEHLGCNAAISPDLVYRFVTTTTLNLSASARPVGTSTISPVISIRIGPCATGASLGCDNHAPSAGLSLTALPAGEYFAIVEALSGKGRALISISLTPPSVGPTNDTCAGAEALSLTANAVSVVGSTAQATADVTASCSASTSSGNDVVYSLVVPAQSTVTATVRAVQGSAVHPVLSLRDACATAGSERLCVASALGESHSISAQLDAGTYALWVDSADSTSGAFQLDVTSVPVLANDSCAGAQVLAFGGNSALVLGDTRVAGNSGQGSDGTPSCSTSARSGGNDLVYSYTLTSPRDVSLTVTPTGSAPSFLPVLSVRRDCASIMTADERACVSQLTTGPATIDLQNQPAGTYFVWVDGAANTSGPFQLVVTTSNPTPPPANDSCTAPQALTFAGTTATAPGSTLQARNDNNAYDVSPTCSSSARQTGRDVVYSFTLAAPNDVYLEVARAPWSQLSPVMYLRRANCNSQLVSDELVCLAGATRVSTTLTSLSPGTYFVFVDSSAGTSGDFTLTVRRSAPTSPPANDACPGTALAFTGDTATASGTTFGAGNSNDPIDLAPTCGTDFIPRKWGRDLVYSVTLAAPQDLDIRVTPSASNLVPAVYVRAPNQCGSFSTANELGCQAAATSGPAALYLPNLPAGTYPIFVDSNSYDTGAFELSVTRRPPTQPPANDTCGAPVALTLATSAVGDTTGAVNNFSIATTPAYSAACGTRFFNGRDVVFDFAAPATRTYTLTVTPSGLYDPAVMLLTGSCNASACSRFADAAGRGGIETLTFAANQGETVYFVVDSYDASQLNAAGAFGISIQ